MSLLKQTIGLASQSPRRKALMKEAGFNIQLIPSPGDELYPDSIPTFEVAEYLAIQKAVNALPYKQDLPIILAADTVVIFENQILGKPKDRNEAISVLKALSGNTHLVISGVCIIAAPFKSNFSVSTEVDMATMTDWEIEYYVDQFQPYDKAGSYAIQEWIGLTKVTAVKGSYTNVIGLPMAQVYAALSQIAIKIEHAQLSN